MDRLTEKITAAVKNPQILIALGLTGILLICLPSFFGGSKKNETVRGGEINVEEYRAGLEKSVEEIVSSITGSKSVKVVITLESGIIYSYADTNEGVSANKTGSGQESTSSESKQSYITVKTADGGEKPFIHGKASESIASVMLRYTGNSAEVKEERTLSETDYEVRTEEELEESYGLEESENE